MILIEGLSFRSRPGLFWSKYTWYYFYVYGAVSQGRQVSRGINPRPPSIFGGEGEEKTDKFHRFLVAVLAIVSSYSARPFSVVALAPLPCLPVVSFCFVWSTLAVFSFC